MTGHLFINVNRMDMKFEKKYYTEPEIVITLLRVESHVCLSNAGITATAEQADEEEWSGIY